MNKTIIILSGGTGGHVLPSVYFGNHLIKNDYKLCDFYISSSYKSYLPCTNYYDYASLDSISNVIKSGMDIVGVDTPEKM